MLVEETLEGDHQLPNQDNEGSQGLIPRISAKFCRQEEEFVRMRFVQSTSIYDIPRPAEHQ